MIGAPQAYQVMTAGDRDRLVKAHLPLVSFLSDRMMTQVPAFMTREDVASAAMLGLVDASNRFDPGKGVLFKTFAEPRIRGAIIDEVRRMDWFSRGLREKQSRIEEALATLERRLGHAPEEAEVAAVLNVSIEEYRQMLGDVGHLGCVSLQETLDGTEDGRTLLENLGDPEGKDPLEILETSELTRDLARLLESLTEKERLVISLYYYEELTQKEIAEVLELTEGRISQLHSQALLKLKGKLGRQGGHPARARL